MGPFAIKLKPKGKSNKSQGQTESGSPVFFLSLLCPQLTPFPSPHTHPHHQHTHPPHHQHTHTHTHNSTHAWTTQPPPTLPHNSLSFLYLPLPDTSSSSSNHACESPPLVKSDPERLLSLPPFSLCCNQCPGPAHHLLQGSSTTTPNWAPYETLHFNLLIS